ncbi:Hypothetical radical SAM family enzyme in heat shock gene cluster, similarity with CPO of BS HemN-type [hydrothermal vent metagenome]|uniref:Hypothetical radical SAM family enzyme in heat shock gene cluster, similarity with CPO of BS HemN-type n=1 Tax=hydrothermal vent metagenome TaxID=652676 RepID=A0A3B0V7H2_9ZZZZ
MNVPRLDNKGNACPTQTVGLYLHIPYCRRKCPYCSFASTAKDTIPEREYTDCLKLELEQVLKNEEIGKETRADSIYFGGGTPSLFAASLIGELIGAARARLTINAETEITIELNPDSCGRERLKELKGCGVNRLSIGVQSLNDRELKTLGRLHNAEQAVRAFKEARAAGFTNIGVDIISGTPAGAAAALAKLSETLDKVVGLGADHISVYGLTIEDGTPFARAIKDGRLELYNEDTERELYLLAVARLEAAGFDHYEVSNFARPGMQSRHNSRYWSGGDYIGLGASAHSFMGRRRPAPDNPELDGDWGRRWWNTKDAAEYIKITGGGGRPWAGSETLTKEQAATEAIMLGLRQSKGVDEEAFRTLFGSSPQSRLVRKGLLKEGSGLPGGGRLIDSDNGRLRLTKAGMLLSDQIY